MSRQKTARQIIINTYMQLLKEMPLNKITVSLLLKKSYVSRSTFYYNFASLDEVLNATMEYFCELLKETMQITESFTLSEFESDSYLYKQIVKVATRVYEERDVFSALLHSSCRQLFLERFANTLIDGYRPLAHLRDGEQIPINERRYFDYNAAYNTVGHYLCWHDGGFAETPEEFAEISYRMSNDKSVLIAPF